MNTLEPSSGENPMAGNYLYLIPTMGLWAFFVSLIYLITGHSLHSASMTFPELHWAESTSCELGKEKKGTTEDEMVGWHHQPYGYALE